MKAQASAVFEAAGRLGRVTSEPPLTLRQVRHDDPGVTALCLVGTAAGPLPGDHLELNLDVQPGARAELSATGASIAQGRGGDPAELHTTVFVGENAVLNADPGTLIVCAGARLDVRLDIDLAPTASLVWRELLVLGRTGEAPGIASLHWRVNRNGRPLLRQTISIDPADTWPGQLRGARVLLTELRVGPGVEAETKVHSPTDVCQRIAANAELRTVLGDEAFQSRR